MAEYWGAHTWRFWARTTPMFVIPSTKHIASRILDLPLPFRPVIELKVSSLWKLSGTQTAKILLVIFTILKSLSAQHRIWSPNNNVSALQNICLQIHTSIITSTTLILAVSGRYCSLIDFGVVVYTKCRVNKAASWPIFILVPQAITHYQIACWGCCYVANLGCDEGSVGTFEWCRF